MASQAAGNFRERNLKGRGQSRQLSFQIVLSDLLALERGLGMYIALIYPGTLFARRSREAK